MNFPTSLEIASAIHLENIVATIVGTMNSKLPVNSNMITTRDTVIRVMPPSTAAAPTIAYRPGITQSFPT